MHESASTRIGTQVRARRHEQGLTIDALARQAGVSARTIVNIEGGAHNPRLDVIERVAGALGFHLVAS